MADEQNVIELRIKLQAKQEEAFYKSFDTPVLFYGGAKGGGKSFLIRAREVYRRMKYEGSSGLIVRKTFPELKANHIRKFFKEYPITAKWYKEQEKTIYWPNGSTTEFSYLQNTNDVYTYQGREYDDIAIDEITQHEEEVFEVLRSSLRTTNPEIKPTMLLTGNPGGIGHGWVKRVFIDKNYKDDEEPNDFYFIQAFVQDNKKLMEADPAYVRRLDNLPTHLRRAYKEGDWDIFAGQVFDWRAVKDARAYHVIKPQPIPANATRFISIDWGGNAPVSIGWMALFSTFNENGIKFDRIWKYRELYYGVVNEIPSAEDFKSRHGIDFTDENVAKIIAEETGDEAIEYVVGDPSMFSSKPRSVTNKGKSVAETMNDYWTENGYDLFIKPGDNDRKNGLDRTRFYLSEAPDGLPYYQVFDTCKNTLRTYPLLIYKDGTNDVDSDIEDHIYDSDRYGFMSRPYGSLEEKVKQPKETMGTFEYHLEKMRKKRIMTSLYS